MESIRSLPLNTSRRQTLMEYVSTKLFERKKDEIIKIFLEIEEKAFDCFNSYFQTDQLNILKLTFGDDLFIHKLEPSSYHRDSVTLANTKFTLSNKKRERESCLSKLLSKSTDYSKYSNPDSPTRTFKEKVDALELPNNDIHIDNVFLGQTIKTLSKDFIEALDKLKKLDTEIYVTLSSYQEEFNKYRSTRQLIKDYPQLTEVVKELFKAELEDLANKSNKPKSKASAPISSNLDIIL